MYHFREKMLHVYIFEYTLKIPLLLARFHEPQGGGRRILEWKPEEFG
jgi:hypothetical protein